MPYDSGTAVSHEQAVTHQETFGEKGFPELNPLFPRIAGITLGCCIACYAHYFEVMSQLLIWYDSGCPLCRREIALMRRLDRRNAIQFVDILGSDTSCPISREDALARFHANEDGRILSGAAAFAAMWRAIPVLRPIGLAARNETVLAVLEKLYAGFLRVRPRMQSIARWLEQRARAK